MHDKITGIVVNHNTPEFLKCAVESITSKYQSMRIIIIDGSKPKIPGYFMASKLAEGNKNIECVQMNQNIGHGRGIDLGMGMVKTEFALLFDSDIVMRSPCLEEMISTIGPNDYGCGQVIKTDTEGCNNSHGDIDYLHPHFAVIRRNVYFNYNKAIHHGAPLIKAMRNIKGLGLLRDFPVKEYITHYGRGTVKLKPREFKASTWDK